jgi:hypothetical protein
MCGTGSVRGRRCFEPFDKPTEPILFRLRHDQEFDADTLSAAPSDRRIVDHDGVGFARHMKEERDLHAGERRDHAFDAAPPCGNVTNRSLVAKLVPLNQGAGHGNGKTPVLASNHMSIVSYGLSGCGLQPLEKLCETIPF